MAAILLVDDNREIRELLSATLSFHSHTVLHAERGDEAIKTARAERPDLIIMDVEMPGDVDGVEATRVVKNTPETQHCAIIVVSGTRHTDKLEACLEAGASACLTKPFSPLELIGHAQRILTSGSRDGQAA